jgi:succinate dehydrogenase / fumarate reductase, cytochrome b subunit
MSDPFRPVRTSIGSKFLVALTGLGLVGFVLVHMSGNLLVFAGQDAMNTYAAKLKAFGWLLWAARAGLLALFVLHVWLALRLTAGNRSARPVGYVYEDVLQASWASRYMWLTGLVLLAFLLFHLAHFTFGYVHRAELQSLESFKDRSRRDPVKVNKHYLELAEVKQSDGEYRPDRGVNYEWHFLPKKEKEDVRHDVYSMVVSGYRVPWITALYLVSMLFLALHLWHGASSMFQSMGANAASWKRILSYVGPALALIVLLGNCSIPLAVAFGIVK